ncbi:zinc ribbon domain-containing protein, partial [Staphylococcus aureus]|nr:zinc ribbon domain-containing protein [Staphylococcus aureus]
VLKLRHWLRSRVFAAVGVLIRQHRPETVVIERLDFRAPGLSRRMNRLLANFGQGAFRKWLEEHQSLYDYRLEEVNAAFSSQQCAACGYVDPRNRA